MAYSNYFLIFIIGVLGSNFARCAEFVPVYMWGTNKMSEHVPALHKISQDSFKDTLLEYLKNHPQVIVFAERTLSPEDFAQHNQNGESAFVNIQQLRNKKTYVSYRPYVQNPIEAIKQVNKPITQISISSILSSFNVPKDSIWIINLDDAKEDETRFHMLKRHDFDIVSIYKDILNQHDNVLVLYTANHTAWVAPDDITHSGSRNLLQAEDKPQPREAVLKNTTGGMVYLTDFGQYQSGTTKINITNSAEFKITNQDKNTVTATLSESGVTLTLPITQKQGYWYIVNATINGKEITGTRNMYAPVGFSYHCGSLNLTDKNKTLSLYLPGFQIQVFSNKTAFGDAYDCVGFTTVPIWSGLFVTAILLLIITFGLTLMMDIKTMDRFDDPKGKTITVTASE